MVTPLLQHLTDWKDCDLCNIKENRQYVVLHGGPDNSIPCDILFVGEAPGESEDTLGYAFAGPVGFLFRDHILKPLFAKFQRKYTWAMTNMVCCIPRDETGNKTTKPYEQEILNCGPRLQEFVDLAQPKLVVLVGDVAHRWFPRVVDYDGPTCEIVHPGSLIRMNIAIRGLKVQEQVIILLNAIEDEIPF